MAAVGYSVAQVADLLECDESTIIRRIQAGQLPAETVTGRRGGRSGQVYQVTTDALRLHVQQLLPARSGQAAAEPIDLGTFLARGGMSAVGPAANRRDTIQAALNVTGPNKVEQLRKLAAEADVHLSTLYGWINAAKANGGATLEGAARTMRRSKFDENGMHRRSSIEPDARRWFQTRWLQLNSPNVWSLVETEYMPKATAMGWSVPSRATFYRIVSEDLTPIERTLARDGTDTVRATLLPKNTRRAPTQRNYLWVADHRQLDYWVWDADAGKAIRPWVCVILDAGSRVPVGYAPARTPSAANVRKAFTMGVYSEAPKMEMGLPKYFLTDRGSEFRDERIQSMVHGMGVKMYMAEQGAGWGKGWIESFYNTMQMYHDRRSRSWTGNNPLTRPDELDVAQLAADGKLENYDDWAAQSFPEWIEWYATQHHHHGDGMNGKTPMERYTELPSGSIGLPSKRAFDHQFMRSEDRQVSKDGVKLFGRLFWHHALCSKENRINRILMGETVTVRWDEEDTSRAFVFFRDEYVCTIADKARPSHDPEDEANVALAHELHGVAMHALKVTHESLVANQQATGEDTWIPKKPKLVVDKTKCDGQPAKPKAPRMITPSDRVADAIQEDKQKATEAKRKSDPTVAAKVRQIGSGGLLG